MEQITLMPASAAKDLSLKKAITIENVAKAIESQCNNGNTNMRFFDIELPFDVMQQVLESGYSISKATGQFKESITIISW